MPDLLLVGCIHPGDLPKIDVGKSSVEVFLLEADSLSQKLLISASKSLDGAVWGLRMRAIKGADVEGLKRAGCDFVVFEAAETEAAVLNDDDMGRFLSVASDLSDGDARAAHELPIDGVAVTIDAGSFPLKVATLMRVNQALMAGASALVSGDFDPGSISTGDLEAMRGAGVTALVVPASDGPGLATLRKAIKGLPEPKGLNEGRMALIPHATGEEYEEDEGDYDDDDF